MSYRENTMSHILESLLSSSMHFVFPVPFDEDDKDRAVWFLDHDYLENMYSMFKKVNGKWCSRCSYPMSTLL